MSNNKKEMFVSFILDETGSMLSVKQETISGFNEYLQTLKSQKKSKKIKFTLTKFNSDKVEVVYDAIKLKNVKSLDDENYQPAAMTPLYDAIGKTVRSIERQSKEGKVLIVIQTDGHENYSKEYDRKGVFDLIEEKKKDGWTFAFLGADQDAWLAAKLIGIPKGNAMSYDSSQTRGTLGRLALYTSEYLNSDGAQTNNFFSDPKEDEIHPLTARK